MVLFQTSLNLGVQRNSYFDSSDSDCSVSDDEGDCKIEEKLKKGKILKAGFLRKKVRMCSRIWNICPHYLFVNVNIVITLFVPSYGLCIDKILWFVQIVKSRQNIKIWLNHIPWNL